MGGLTSAVHWWEEWQLRVLVLTSLAIQFFLFNFPYLRRRAVPGWFRIIMWLAYHGGDAVAIYALATLFNRHKEDEGSDGSNTLLEVVWAPILLIHLGGCDGVTAYNIEDNELWTRHLLTAVSQVTVAIYVFCKSWLSAAAGGDKRLLQAAILLFTVGVVKCLVKAWAFKRASIYSLVGSASAAARRNNGNMYELKEYVNRAKDFIIVREQEEDQGLDDDDDHPLHAGTITDFVLVEMTKELVKRALGLFRRSNKHEAGDTDHPPSQAGSFFGRLKELVQKTIRQSRERRNNPARRERLIQQRGEAFKLFVDLSSPYSHRIAIFKKFWGRGEERAYDSVRRGLATAFLLLYTKLKTASLIDADGNSGYIYMGIKSGGVEEFIRNCIQFSRLVLPWASVGLFHRSHREAYNDIDVKITYAVFCCTAVLESFSIGDISSVVQDVVSQRDNESFSEVWPDVVAQYSLAGYFVRNRKHSNKMRIVSLFGWKDFLDQHWCMELCFSSATITQLVLRYLKEGWKQEIQDAASYRSFNNHSSHWGLNMNKPFDECVLLWHLATEFCFFSNSFPEHTCAFDEAPTAWSRVTLKKLLPKFAVILLSECAPVDKNQNTSQCRQESLQCKAILCRQMSNYMVYLLFVNPDMLLPGTRRNLFKIAHDELKHILRDRECNPGVLCWSRWTPCGVKLVKEEAMVMDRLITVMRKKASQEKSSKEANVTDTIITVMPEKSEKGASQEESSTEGSNKEENLIDEAWALAQSLSDMGDEKMWEEMKNVWVQMLCFSASRCRGYLHAKALGKGGEFLSYVWLLLFHMGMETFSERLQRDLLLVPGYQGNNGTAAPPSASEVSTTGTAPSASEVHTMAGAGTGATSSTSEITMAED